jgi:isopropylmalate/homocitrate/citramalate synthase
MDTSTPQKKIMSTNNLSRKILVIDQTLREGMQFQGIVFSLAQRIKILEFQEALRIDVCQAGYPSAHPMEAKIVSKVAAHAKKNNFCIRTSALGRAFAQDADILCNTDIDDIHFHLQVKNTITKEAQTRLFQDIEALIGLVRNRRPGAAISIAMLDIGKTDNDLLTTWVRLLGKDLGIDILSLPDTSGIMAPNQIHDKILALSSFPLKSKLSVHCHNDRGMASANSIMGIIAGAGVLEVSALGIGERNGIGDLFSTAKLLQTQGMTLGVDTDNLKLFQKYYGFLDTIVREQTGAGLIQCNTPVFGEAVKTHVAGTHAGGKFGTLSEEKFYLNLLCGQTLVQKYLKQKNISHDKKKLQQITAAIKTESITLERRLTSSEIEAIVLSVL